MMNELFRLALVFSGLLYSFAFKIKLQHNVAVNDFSVHWSSTLTLIPYNIPTMTVCFGIPNQCFNLAPTLTSGFTIVQSIAITDKLFPNSFNMTHSTTIENLMHHLQFRTLNNNIKGRLVRDVALIPNIPQPSFENKLSFLIYDSFQNKLDLPIDGFIGLQKYYSNDDVFYTPNGSFVKYLYTSHIIERKIFALSYSNKDESYIEFSEIYPEYNKCRSPKSNYSQREWDCNLTEVIIGETRVNITNNVVSFDSILKTITVPSQFKESIFFNLLNGLFPNQCQLFTDSGQFLIQCEETININLIPDLMLVMENDVQLVIQWTDIFKKVLLNDTRTVYLSLLIFDESSPSQWKIGLPGMLNKKIIFNTIDNSIGIIIINEVISKKVVHYISYASITLLTGGILLLVSIHIQTKKNK